MDIYLHTNILSLNWMITTALIGSGLLSLFVIILYKTKIGKKISKSIICGGIIGNAIGFTAIMLSSLIN